MILKKKGENISNREFKQIIVPFSNNVNRFLEEYLIPELIAYYLAVGYYRSCIYEEKYDAHINSILAEIFNYRIKNINKLKNKINDILNVKYGLSITNENPLIFKQNKY